MRSDDLHRHELDTVIDEHLGHLLPVVVTPYLVAYVGSTLASSGSLGISGGPFVVVLAVLLVGSVATPSRRWQPSSRAVRLAVVAACALLGVVVAVLVEGYGLT